MEKKFVLPDQRLIPMAEEKKLLSLVSNLKGKQPARDKMVMEIGFGLGLRVAEMISLTVGNVRNQKALRIVEKGNKGRVIEINKHLQRAIKDFIKMKLAWNESIHDDAPLFVSRNGDRLSRRSLQEMFKNWCIRAGLIAKNGKAAYTFYCMRHTFNMRLRERIPDR